MSTFESTHPFIKWTFTSTLSHTRSISRFIFKAIKLHWASHALGAGRLRNVYGADTQSPKHAHTRVDRELLTLKQKLHLYLLYLFISKDLCPSLVAHILISFPLPYFELSTCFSHSRFLQRNTSALTCCVVGRSGERGPDPEKRGGVWRLLTPGVQTAANGEQVWRRGRGEDGCRRS